MASREAISYYNAYLTNFYPVEAFYEVNMELFGFETEEELDDITLTLTDADGNVVYQDGVEILRTEDTESLHYTVTKLVPGEHTAISHTTSIRFEWDAATDIVGVDHYEVYRDGLKIAETAGTICDDSELAMGSYTYTIKAVDARGNVGEKTVSITVDNTPPAESTGLTAQATSRYIHVMWDTGYVMSSDFACFRLYRAAEENGAYTMMKESRAVGYYDDGDTAEIGETYYYCVTAVDDYGNESARGQIVSATFIDDTESPEIGDMLHREGEIRVPLAYAAEDNVAAIKVFLLNTECFLPLKDAWSRKIG